MGKFLRNELTFAKLPLPDPSAEAEQKPVDVHTVLTTDEYAGRGGSYVFDPATGKRTPANHLTTEKE